MDKTEVAANEKLLRESVDRYGRTISAVMDWPPIPGKLSMLLMMVSEELTIPDIQKYLGVSAGSVSQATRLLIRAGVIERVRIPGRREHFFRWREDAWVGCIRHQADQLATIKTVAVDAVQNKNLSAAQLHSFEQMLDYYTATAAAFDRIAVSIAETFKATGSYRPDREL